MCQEIEGERKSFKNNVGKCKFQSISFFLFNAFEMMPLPHTLRKGNYNCKLNFSGEWKALTWKILCCFETLTSFPFDFQQIIHNKPTSVTAEPSRWEFRRLKWSFCVIVVVVDLSRALSFVFIVNFCKELKIYNVSLSKLFHNNHLLSYEIKI